MDLEWIDVDEDLPIKPPNWRSVTDNVEVKLTDGSIVTGYYSYEYDRWYNYHTSKRIPDNQVKAWRSK